MEQKYKVLFNLINPAFLKSGCKKAVMEFDESFSIYQDGYYCGYHNSGNPKSFFQGGATDREISFHPVALFFAGDFRGAERGLRKIRGIEEICGAQVSVALIYRRINARYLYREFHLGLGKIFAQVYGTGKFIEAAGDARHEKVFGLKRHGGMQGIDFLRRRKGEGGKE